MSDPAKSRAYALYRDIMAPGLDLLHRLVAAALSLGVYFVQQGSGP